jgi:hypothetical protein
MSAARETQHPTEVEQSRKNAPPFSNTELAGSLRQNAELLGQAAGRGHGLGAAAYSELAAALNQLAVMAEAGELSDLESLEQRLTVMEEKMIAAATQNVSEKELVQARVEMQKQLAPYRHKMTAGQLALLEKQYLQRRMLEAAGLPRLSLFYL